MKDPEFLDELCASGWQGVFIGFESVDNDSLGSVHKVQNRAEFYDTAVQALHERGIMINASFVFGLDNDTPETFPATLKWIVKHRIETVTSHILTPYPGTKLYARLESEGRITERDLGKYNTANVVFRPKGMTAQELYDGYLGIYRDVYSLPNIFRRLPASRRQRAPYLLFNLLYRKYGRLTDAACRLVGYKRIGALAERWSRLG